MALGSTKEELALEIDLEATEEIDLDDTASASDAASVRTGTSSPAPGLNVPPSSKMHRTNSSNSSLSSSPNNVRSRAALWENKDSANTNTKPPPSSRPMGRKRSGTTATRPIVTAAAGRLNGAAARTAEGSSGASPASTSSPTSAFPGSATSRASPSSMSSPPSAFKSASPDKPAGAAGLKTLKLGAGARTPASTSPASASLSTPPAAVPPVPAAREEAPPPSSPERTTSRSPNLGSAASPAAGKSPSAPSPLASPEGKAASTISRSPQSVYDSVAGSPLPTKEVDLAPIVTNASQSAVPAPALGLELSEPLAHSNGTLAVPELMARGSTPGAEDSLFLSPVDLNDDTTVELKESNESPVKDPLPKGERLDLSPKVAALEPKADESEPTPAPEDTLDLKLETIDLNGPSSLDNQAPARDVDEDAAGTGAATAAPEPETIVTPASPVVRETTALSARKAVPSTEAALLAPTSPAGSSPSNETPNTPGFADIPLTPAALPPNSPSPAPPTRMASLFTRVLDYGKQADAKKEKEKKEEVAEEKKLPEPPRKQTQNASGKSFFTSAASGFSFNLPSLQPLRTATQASSSSETTSPPTENPPPVKPESPSMLSEPKPASNWRTTMTHFLSSRGSSSTANSGTNVSNSSSSTNLLLHRLDDPTSVRDRRISREYGGGEQLREGFERVRNEMEGAARDIRREIARGEEQPDVEGIDWSFWGAVVQDYEAVARERPKELSKAIQQGIPTVIRGPIWQLMSSSKSAELEETYKALLKLTSPHEKAIHKDISRTFPNHKFFKDTGAGQDGLFMVVKAYSLYDREVGYTQGLAFIVAALLLNMPDEEAFCVLVRLMDSYNLRSHYLADMPGLQLRLYQFDRLLEDVLPLLHNHLVRKGVKSSMYASQWFMTLFSYRFPLSLVYRVFDIVLAEGIEAIFRFAIALLKKSEDELLKLEFEQILNVLQGDLFEAYRSPDSERSDTDSIRESEWLTNDFVRDAYAVHITPLMLDHYEAEWEERCRAQTEHTRELEQLRAANKHLSAQVKSLESSIATMNQEHVEIVRQLVLAKIAKEDMENELVKYKSMCARLSQQQVEEDSSSGPHASLQSYPSGLNLYAVRSNSSSKSRQRNNSNGNGASPSRSTSASPIPSPGGSPRL